MKALRWWFQRSNHERVELPEGSRMLSHLGFIIDERTSHHAKSGYTADCFAMAGIRTTPLNVNSPGSATFARDERSAEARASGPMAAQASRLPQRHGSKRGHLKLSIILTSRYNHKKKKEKRNRLYRKHGRSSNKQTEPGSTTCRHPRTTRQYDST